jgi:signal transduction histidine kinase
VVRITDSGIGIPPEKLASIFELFTQVHEDHSESQAGLGIGLALARELVTLHGGSIQASSEGPGKGSQFIVRLPVAAPAVD